MFSGYVVHMLRGMSTERLEHFFCCEVRRWSKFFEVFTHLATYFSHSFPYVKLLVPDLQDTNRQRMRMNEVPISINRRPFRFIRWLFLSCCSISFATHRVPDATLRIAIYLMDKPWFVENDPE